MDCFTISVVSGVIVRKKDFWLMIRIAFLFGLFQGMMPVFGWLLTSSLSGFIKAIDHWIAFSLLAFIGGKMIADAFKTQQTPSIDPRKLRTRLLLAVATSIDALAIGITFACTGYSTFRSIIIPIAVIGAVSFLMSMAGFLLGVRSGDFLNRNFKPSLIGGIILIAIGIKILIEHLA